jgi:hypothetical protein
MISPEPIFVHTPIVFFSMPCYHWIMNGLYRVFLVFFCLLLVVTAGCSSPAIETARYQNEGIAVSLTSDTGIPDAWMQVTIYRITDLRQEEYRVVNAPVTLKNGKNEVYLSAPLEPGRYKLYIYLIRNGQRTTAVIRDIVV